jgi:hypothetical protein
MTHSYRSWLKEYCSYNVLCVPARASCRLFSALRALVSPVSTVITLKLCDTATASAISTSTLIRYYIALLLQEAFEALEQSCTAVLLQDEANSTPRSPLRDHQHHSAAPAFAKHSKAQLMTAMLGETAAAKLSSQRKGAEAVMRKLQALAEAADAKRRPLLQTVHSCNEELQPLEARRAALLEELAQVTAVT